MQAKAVIGAPDDAFEQEADAVSSKVTNGEAVPMVSRLPSGGLARLSRSIDDEEPVQAISLQRQADESEEALQAWPVQRQATSEDDETVQAWTVQRNAVGEEQEPLQAWPVQRQTDEETQEPVQSWSVQRNAEPEEETVQTLSVQRNAEVDDEESTAPCASCVRRDAPAAAPATPAMNAVAQQAVSSPGVGAPMDSGTQHTLESSFGTSLGDVRVHASGADRHTSAELKARAFTHRNHIWLGPGESDKDLPLMAHETTHVLQQDGVVRRLPQQEPGRRPAEPRGGGTASGSASNGGGAAPAPASPPPAAPARTANGQGAGAPAAPAPASADGPGAEAAPAASSGVPALPELGGGAAGGPELLMPEPPEGLSEADQQRLAEVERNASAATEATEELPSAGESVAESRAAVEEPEDETAARAAGELVASLGGRAAPSPEVEQLCEKIRTAISRRRPPDEESLVEFNPRQAAQSAGAELNSSVQGDAERVQSNYNQINETPEGTPQQEAQPLETPPEQVETPAINATQAVPDAVPAENVSLDADVASGQQRIEDAGMATQPAELIEDPSNPVVQAREAQGELSESAQRDPQEVLAEQSAIRAQAQGAMQSLQEQALQALQTSRRSTVGEVGGGMRNMGTTEEEMRRNAGAEAQRIFDDAQKQVTDLLNPLSQTAMQRWETGVQVLSTQVEQQSAEFNEWKRKRYEGLAGTALEVVEYFTGLPDWAVNWLNRIEQDFGDGVCDLMREISSEVNSVIATCEEIIDSANSQIASLFQSLPASLQSWAAGEQARFGEQLQGLRNRANSAREDFNRQMADKAAQSVQQVRESIHSMREAAKGLFGRISDAVDRFAEDPAKFIIDGLLKLVGIPPGAFWALVNRIGSVIDSIADDPMNFANNLAAALGQGFQKFFDNFKDHVIGGFFDWLFSGLGTVGVQLPPDTSLGSLITFFLQLMGITWPRIRQILAKHIGEENVALIEKAYELVSTLIELGPQGIYEMIKEKLNPQAILDQVIQAAVDFLIDALIKAVTPRIIGLFNPAGAIAQAIEVVYRILSWIFQNAARIFSLVETIVNGAAELVAGNTGGMATAVEGALARLVAPVIDFLAGFLGLGDLPQQIADAIGALQEMVLSVIDEAVGWLAERARALLRSLGLADDEEEEDESDHGALAARAKSELETTEGEAADYDAVRAAKEIQARDIESRYTEGLEDGVALKVLFSARSSDQADQDIDFTIEIGPNTTTKPGSIPLGADDDKIVDITSFGPRPTFRSSTREELEVEEGEHRRHIAAWETMHIRLVQVINGKTVAKAAEILSRVSTRERDSYTVDPRNQDGVKQTGYSYLQDKHNDESNLWVGPGRENSSLGSRARWARERATAALANCDRAEFDAQMAELEVTWHDPDQTGSGKTGFRNEVTMAIRVLRREYRENCPEG